MITPIAKRILLALPTMIGVSVVVFITIKIIPGSPVDVMLGPYGTPEARAELEQRLGLTAPLPAQYLSWLGHALMGDFGMSIARRTEVGPLAMNALGNTLLLASISTLLAVLLGVVGGWIMATRQGTILARAVNGSSLLSISIPQYTLGLFLIFSFAVTFRVFPTSGMFAPGGGSFGDLLWHAVLPSVTAALVPAGVIARMFRATVLDVMSLEFTEALRARGFGRARTAVHVLHNSVPSLLNVVGLQIGYLLGGVIIVEAVFAWPGIGQLVYQSIGQRDLPVIQAGVLISALAFVVVNLVVDSLIVVVDPRVRA